MKLKGGNVWILLVIFIIIVISISYFIDKTNMIEGLGGTPGNNANAPGNNANAPGNNANAPGNENNEPAQNSNTLTTLCESLKSPGTSVSSISDLKTFVKLLDNLPNTDNRQQIQYSINNLLPVYQGSFLDLTNKICSIQNRIKNIKQQIPKTVNDIVVGGVTSVDYETATQSPDSIYLNVNVKKGGGSDPNFGKWVITAALPMGPTGKAGNMGPPGEPGKPGPEGPEGPQGIRGSWATSPNYNINSPTILTSSTPTDSMLQTNLSFSIW